MRRRAIRDGFGREFRDMPARSNQRKPAQHGPHPLMKLQRSVGNQAVLRLLRSATVPADSGNTRLQRAVEYIDMTSDQAFEENREREIIQDWAGLVKKFPEFSGSPPLDEIVFQYGISIVKWKNGYTLNIQEKGWTYNQVPLSEVYQRLKRFEGFVKGKAIVTLDNGTSLIDPKGIGLSVTHSVLNAEGKKYTGYYKVMESVHKVEENQSYDLSVEAMGEFGDFHHFVHDLEYLHEGTRTTHQIWIDQDHDEVIPKSGFEIVKKVKLLGEDMYWVTITKKPKKVTVDGVAVEPGQGSARTTFLMRWSGNRFEFVR